MAREVIVLAYRLLLEACGTSRQEARWLEAVRTPSWDADVGQLAPRSPMLAEAVEDARAILGGLQMTGPAAFEQLAGLYERLLGVGVEPANHGAGLRWQTGTSMRRRRSGAFYTPPALVEHLLDLALEPTLDDWLAAATDDPVGRLLAFRVCDPACGTGRFLIAAQRRLAARLQAISNASDQEALALVARSCLFGVDVDPCAAALCRTSLVLATDHVAEELEHHIKVGNALVGLWPQNGLSSGSPLREIVDHNAASVWLARHGVDEAASETGVHWPLDFPDLFPAEIPIADEGSGFHVVLGNPPFLNQLARGTAVDRSSASVLREVSGGAVRGYADMASAFLLLAMRLCRDGGRVAMLQPLSVLASAGTAPIRARLQETTSIESVWVADGHSFEDTSVPVCAPVLIRSGAGPSSVRRTRGMSFEAASPIDPEEIKVSPATSWAALAAFDVPRVPLSVLRGGGLTVGDLAECTADFRDEYYRLSRAIREANPAEQAADPGCWKLVTSGLIDLASCKWGRAKTQILKQRWNAPTVDQRAIDRDPKLASWIRRRAVPKVLLATQTRVLEVIADPSGCMLPVTPVISVVPHQDHDLWRIAAALASPLATILAIRRHGGAAMSPSAIKLSARQVAALPVPVDHAAWAIAADAFRQFQEAAGEDRLRALERFGHAALSATGQIGSGADKLFEFWKEKIPS